MIGILFIITQLQTTAFNMAISTIGINAYHMPLLLLIPSGVAMVGCGSAWNVLFVNSPIQTLIHLSTDSVHSSYT